MISRTVSLKEATRSQTATRLGLENIPLPEQIKAMEYVAERVIDTVRERFPAVDVSSFFRSKELNKAVGGSETSQHCLGEAVDLDSSGDTLNLEIFKFIKENMVFDQLILEYPDKDGVPSWVHVSVIDISKDSKRRNRGQILVKLKEKYIPYSEFKSGMQ